MNIKDHFDRLRDADNWLLPIEDPLTTKLPPRRPKLTLAVLGAAAAVAAVAAVAAIPTAIAHHADSAHPANAGSPADPTPNVKAAIPWKALEASEATPKGNPTAHPSACSPNSLAIKVHPGISPAMGTDYVMVAVENSGSDCTMRDSALTGLHWGNGHHPKAPVASADRPSSIRSGASQRYRLGFPPSCLTNPKDTGTAATEATIDGQQVPVTSGGIPAALAGCDATEVSAVGSPAGSGASTQDAAAPSPYAVLHADTNVADTVGAGTLPYTITLTNNGTAPFDFGADCPDYTQRITFPGSDPIEAHYQLNCDATDALAPGHSVTFAMQENIPSDAITAGDIKLLWQMDDGGPDAGELLNTTHPAQRTEQHDDSGKAIE